METLNENIHESTRREVGITHTRTHTHERSNINSTSRRRRRRHKRSSMSKCNFCCYNENNSVLALHPLPFLISRTNECETHRKRLLFFSPPRAKAAKLACFGDSISQSFERVLQHISPRRQGNKRWDARYQSEVHRIPSVPISKMSRGKWFGNMTYASYVTLFSLPAIILLTCSLSQPL